MAFEHCKERILTRKCNPTFLLFRKVLPPDLPDSKTVCTMTPIELCGFLETQIPNFSPKYSACLVAMELGGDGEFYVFPLLFLDSGEAFLFASKEDYVQEGDLELLFDLTFPTLF